MSAGRGYHQVIIETENPFNGSESEEQNPFVEASNSSAVPTSMIPSSYMNQTTANSRNMAHTTLGDN